MLRMFTGLAISFLTGANLYAAPLTVWSDKSGFVIEDNCRFTLDVYTGFAVANNQTNDSKTIPLKSEKGEELYSVTNYSLLEVPETQMADVLPRHQKVAVVSVSKGPGFDFGSKMAKRHYGTLDAPDLMSSQSLYIADGLLSAFADFTISIFPNARNKNIKIASVPLSKTFWRASYDQDYYGSATCCTGKNQCKDYGIFNVFQTVDNNQSEFVTRVGVRREETAVFEDVRLYPVKSEVTDGESETTDNNAASPKKAPVSLLPESLEKVLEQGTLETVICTEDTNSSLRIVDKDLKTTVHRLKNGTPVKIFQGFDGLESEMMVEKNGTTYHYVQIQSEKGMGYAPKEFLDTEGHCKSIELEAPSTVSSKTPLRQLTAGATPFAAGTSVYMCTDSGNSLSVRDMEFERQSRSFNVKHKEKVKIIDPKVVTNTNIPFLKVETEAGFKRYIGAEYLSATECKNERTEEYVFPVFAKTGFSYLKKADRPYSNSAFARLESYQEAWGRYGAERARTGYTGSHGATDLYQAKGQSLPGVSGITAAYYGGTFRALTNGNLLRKPTAFYMNTYYVHILHADNTIGIYGEIYPSFLPSGDNFSAGQKLGYIKWVGLKSVPPMLHMEHFKGDLAKKLESNRNAWKGDFKINGRKSGRSNDLIDRTKLLRKLELDTF